MIGVIVVVFIIVIAIVIIAVFIIVIAIVVIAVRRRTRNLPLSKLDLHRQAQPGPYRCS